MYEAETAIRVIQGQNQANQSLCEQLQQAWAERDQARAWARAWKRAAKVLRFRYRLVRGWWRFQYRKTDELRLDSYCYAAEIERLRTALKEVAERASQHRDWTLYGAIQQYLEDTADD